MRITKNLGNPKKIVALEYEVLATVNGKEVAVNPQFHKFKIGDTFRVRLTPQTNAYVYFFHEQKRPDVEKKTTCLLPEKGESAPRCHQGEALILPDDGTVFQFTNPPGKETLVVVATDEPVADLDSLGGKAMAGAEAKPLETLKEGSRGLIARSLDDDALQAGQQNLRENKEAKIVFQAPPTKDDRSTLGLAVNTRLVLEIPLSSETVK